MTLIKSISGIRGTIGGKPGDNLTPIDIVKFTSAFGSILKQNSDKKTIVIGRDARISGDMLRQLVAGTLMGLGLNVIDLGLATTPTVEMAVPHHNAIGGIILTASHNPREWNALKLLNEKGEFIDNETGKLVVSMAEKEDFSYAEVNYIGKYSTDTEATARHIQSILELPLVDVEAIRQKRYKIAIDAVNSVGGIAIPELLKALGVETVYKLYCDPTGKFPHNPEPLPEHLSALSQLIRQENCDLGFVVDPDVDRLAIVCEDGEVFGEEYTLVAVADYILRHNPGPTVSNLSSSNALKSITEKAGCSYFYSKVGEVNVVNQMKETGAVIGGEGNGGIIYPELHYGRDALVGVALFLSHLATSGKFCSLLKSTYPNYVISKNKIQLTPDINVDEVLEGISTRYKNQPQIKEDGIKILFDDDWVLLRKSNTEPIIRVYSESNSQTTANNLSKKIIADIGDIVQG